MGEPQISSGGRRNVEKTLPAFGVSLTKPFFLKMGYPNLPKLWHFGLSTFLYLSILLFIVYLFNIFLFHILSSKKIPLSHNIVLCTWVWYGLTILSFGKLSAQWGVYLFIWLISLIHVHVLKSQKRMTSDLNMKSSQYTDESIQIDNTVDIQGMGSPCKGCM